MSDLKNEVLKVLKQIKDPELDRDIVSLGMVRGVTVDQNQAVIDLEVTTPNSEVKNAIESQIKDQVGALESIAGVEIRFQTPQPKGPGVPPKQPIPGIKHVVAVASGKGGVGKSTVSVNLALALAKQGFKVGLMDGDIYGPNIPLMLGIAPDTKPTVGAEEKINPLEVQGIRMISMGVLVPADQPMVWRGPMLHSAVTQFLQKVDWGELDYLLVDLPPGTGDVQLSLVQSVPLSGAVIVTTPQEVALMDVRKGIAMFQKTNVPILGVVENMVGEIFGEGGGQKAAESLKVPFLGKVPLEAKVREGGDAGTPIVVSSPEQASAKALCAAAEAMSAALNQNLAV